MGESQKILQVRSARQVPVRARLLDDDIFELSIDKRAVGWILFDKVCEHLNIIEKDYFGLNFIDPTGEKYWLNNDKKIAKQLKGQNWHFNFEVKFYPADPAQLAEDLTRYQLCLQIRRDIVNGRLPCSFVTYTLLGSYTAQSELGDYDTEEFGSGYKYLKDIQFAPHQDKELLMKIAELHRQHKGQMPEEAETHFLENAKKLAMYGVEIHPARDAEGKEIQLGVSASGITVYKDKQQINRFVWPKVLKISYRRNKFYIKIRPGEFETFASLIGFKLPNTKYAKRLWKICVEHHSFFRFREPDIPKHPSLMPRFGSRFRYSGRTQYQTRQLVAEENREAPYFDRVLSKRGTFAGRTSNMRQRDEERRQRREELRQQPPQTKVPLAEPKTPPEPKRAPPVAPKPKATPRGSTESLDRSLNDSFEDVPDRRSKVQKMNAVPTPLAFSKEAQMEHEQHEKEYAEKEKSEQEAEMERKRRHEEERMKRQEERRRRMEEKRRAEQPESDHEVGNHNQTNKTSQEHRADTNNKVQGHIYANVVEREVNRSNKHRDYDGHQGDKYLFSYPASSRESISSFGEYSGDSQSVALKDRVKSEHNLRHSDRDPRASETNALSHSVSAEALYSEIHPDHYVEIVGTKHEGIYAEIAVVKSEANEQYGEKRSKTDHSSGMSSGSNNTGIHNFDVPERRSIKIYGRRSKLFKANQKAAEQQGLDQIEFENKDTKPNKSHDKTNDGRKFKNSEVDSEADSVVRNKAVKLEPVIADPFRSNSKPESHLGAIPKTNVPLYAKINKSRKGSKQSQKNMEAEKNLTRASSSQSPNEFEGKKIREELKMYILTPEKINESSMKSGISIKSDGKLPEFKLNANLKAREGSERQGEKAENSRRDGTGINQTVSSAGSENQASYDECYKVVVQTPTSESKNDSRVFRLDLGNEQENQIEDLETGMEDDNIELRRRLEDSSLPSLYKFAYDEQVSNYEDSPRLDDMDLERFSTLSSPSSDLEACNNENFASYARGLEYNPELENLTLQASVLEVSDDDLEKFSTVSTDSNEFEDIEPQQRKHFGNVLSMPSPFKKKWKKRKKNDRLGKSADSHLKIESLEQSGKEFQILDVSADLQDESHSANNFNHDLRNDSDFTDEIEHKGTCDKTETETVIKQQMESFELETYQEEPFGRRKNYKTTLPSFRSDAFAEPVDKVEQPGCQFGTKANKETEIRTRTVDTTDAFMKPKLVEATVESDKQTAVIPKVEQVDNTKGVSEQPDPIKQESGRVKDQEIISVASAKISGQKNKNFGGQLDYDCMDHEVSGEPESTLQHESKEDSDRGEEMKLKSCKNDILKSETPMKNGTNTLTCESNFRRKLDFGQNDNSVPDFRENQVSVVKADNSNSVPCERSKVPSGGDYVPATAEDSHSPDSSRRESQPEMTNGSTKRCHDFRKLGVLLPVGTCENTAVPVIRDSKVYSFSDNGDDTKIEEEQNKDTASIAVAVNKGQNTQHSGRTVTQSDKSNEYTSRFHEVRKSGLVSMRDTYENTGVPAFKYCKVSGDAANSSGKVKHEERNPVNCSANIREKPSENMKRKEELAEQANIFSASRDRNKLDHPSQSSEQVDTGVPIIKDSKVFSTENGDNISNRPQRNKHLAAHSNKNVPGEVHEDEISASTVENKPSEYSDKKIEQFVKSDEKIDSSSSDGIWMPPVAARTFVEEKYKAAVQVKKLDITFAKEKPTSAVSPPLIRGSKVYSIKNDAKKLLTTAERKEEKTETEQLAEIVSRPETNRSQAKQAGIFSNLKIDSLVDETEKPEDKHETMKVEGILYKSDPGKVDSNGKTFQIAKSEHVAPTYSKHPAATLLDEALNFSYIDHEEEDDTSNLPDANRSDTEIPVEDLQNFKESQLLCRRVLKVSKGRKGPRKGLAEKRNESEGKHGGMNLDMDFNAIERDFFKDKSASTLTQVNANLVGTRHQSNNTGAGFDSKETGVFHDVRASSIETAEIKKEIDGSNGGTDEQETEFNAGFKHAEEVNSGDIHQNSGAVDIQEGVDKMKIDTRNFEGYDMELDDVKVFEEADSNDQIDSSYIDSYKSPLVTTHSHGNETTVDVHVDATCLRKLGRNTDVENTLECSRNGESMTSDEEQNTETVTAKGSFFSQFNQETSGKLAEETDTPVNFEPDCLIENRKNEQMSLKSKLDAVGLGDINIDEEAVKRQTLESKLIEYSFVHDIDSDSEPSTTDSESGDEIEIASFEMPRLVNTEVEFDDQDSLDNAADQNHFAIDCSFEDVKSYKMDDTWKHESSSILCECMFDHNKLTDESTCRLHCYGHSDECVQKVPVIIDESPHIPYRSNLKKRTKSDSSLLNRRVRFEENLPVYKSCQNVNSERNYANDNEAEKIKHLESFIMALFENEPKRLCKQEPVDDFRGKDSEDTVSENNIENVLTDSENFNDDNPLQFIHETCEKKTPKILKPVTGRRHTSKTDNMDMSVESTSVPDMNQDVSSQNNPEEDKSGLGSRHEIEDSGQGPVAYKAHCSAELVSVGSSTEAEYDYADSFENGSKTNSEYLNVTNLGMQRSVREYKQRIGSSDHVSLCEGSLIRYQRPGDVTHGRFGGVPTDKITRYTFTVEDDSDADSPKIKSVTYEYVTEYKLQNVKIQYQQNRKTQTDSELFFISSSDASRNAIDSKKLDDRDEFRSGTDQGMVDSSTDMNTTEDKETTSIIVEEPIEKSVCCPLGPISVEEPIEKSVCYTLGSISVEEPIEKSVCYPLGPISVEEPIEKSVCYPLGPISGYPLHENITGAKDSSEEEVKKSVSVSKKTGAESDGMDTLERNTQTHDGESSLCLNAKKPEEFKAQQNRNEDDVNDFAEVEEELITKKIFHELHKHKPYKPETPSRALITGTSVKDRQIIEYDSRKFVWQSVSTKIPFSLSGSEDKAEDQGRLEMGRNSFDTGKVKKGLNSAVSMQETRESDGSDGVMVQSQNKESDGFKGRNQNDETRSTQTVTDFDDSADDLVIENQEESGGRKRLQQFCERKLLRRQARVADVVMDVIENQKCDIDVQDSSVTLDNHDDDDDDDDEHK